MDSMRALACWESVTIGTWWPRKLCALYPSVWRCRARRAMVTCSPVETITSYSLPMGNSLASLARDTSLFVSPDMAERTTTTLFPASCATATLRATFFILSTVPTDVPPYFCTIRAIFITLSACF